MKVTASPSVEYNKLLAAEKTKRKEQLLRLLEDEPDASRKKMVATLGIVANTLRIYVVELHKEGRLPQDAYTSFRDQGFDSRRDFQTRMRDLRKGWLVLVLEEEPGISRAELMEGLGVKEDTLKTYMGELEDAGRLPDGAHERLEAQIRALSHRRHLALKRRQKKSRWNTLTPDGRRKRLLKILVKNPTISIRSLASKLIVSTRTVERDRTHLRRLGFITGRGRRLRAATSLVAARRELKLRRLLKLLKANPDQTTKYLADSVSVSQSTVLKYICILRERGDLPEDFMLWNTRMRRQKRMPTERELRRPRVLALIAQDVSVRMIASSIWSHAHSIRKDIEAMRKSGDPGLVEAEKKRDAIRARTPPTRDELEMERALGEIGLTSEEAIRQHEEWCENAGPEDSLLRSSYIGRARSGGC